MIMPVKYSQNYTLFALGARVVNVSSVGGLLNNGIGMPDNSIGLPDSSPWKEKLAKSGSDLAVSMMPLKSSSLKPIRVGELLRNA